MVFIVIWLNFGQKSDWFGAMMNGVSGDEAGGHEAETALHHVRKLLTV